MKKFFYTLFLCTALQLSYAQDEPQGAAAVREKMVEYIQNKLDMSKAEAERFQPLFMDYLNQLRKVKQEHGNDRLVLQQKVVEARLKFRDQVKPVIGDKRSNDVFTHERDFIEEASKQRQERMQERKGGGRNNKRNG
jgi:hypothetical protein